MLWYKLAVGSLVVLCFVKKWTLVNIEHVILTNIKVESKLIQFNIQISTKTMTMQSTVMSEASL